MEFKVEDIDLTKKYVVVKKARSGRGRKDDFFATYHSRDMRNVSSAKVFDSLDEATKYKEHREEMKKRTKYTIETADHYFTKTWQINRGYQDTITLHCRMIPIGVGIKIVTVEDAIKQYINKDIPNTLDWCDKRIKDYENNIKEQRKSKQNYLNLQNDLESKLNDSSFMQQFSNEKSMVDILFGEGGFNEFAE